VAEAGLPLWRRLRRRGYWVLTLGVLHVARRLPRGAARAFGRFLARVALFLRPAERRIAALNLGRALPELTATENRALVDAAADALGENLADTLAVSRILEHPASIREEPLPATGGRPVGRVVAELAEAGRGVLLLTGHLGCWELLGGWLARELPKHGAGPLAVVTGTIHNEPVDRLLQDTRRQLGMIPLPRDGGAAPLLRHLAAGGTVAVLLDQRTRVPSLDAPFFGHPAPTAAGFGKVALRRGIPVLPVAIARRGEGHEVRHLAPLLSEPDEAAARDAERVAEFLGRCNRRLEELIRRNPVEWVWFHRRWE